MIRRIISVAALVLLLASGAVADNRYIPGFTLRVTNSNYLRITNTEGTTKRARCIAIITQDSSTPANIGKSAFADLNITTGSTGDCRPGSGVEWIIQAVVHEGAITLGMYDGTNLINFDTDPATKVSAHYDDSRQFPLAGIVSGTATSIWDLPVSNACVPAAAVPATNTVAGVLQCANGQSAEVSYYLTSSWIGLIDAWLVLAGGGSDTSGTIIPSIAIGCSLADGTTTNDPSYNTADNMSTITLATAANRMWTSTKTGITTTGCAAGSMLHVKIARASGTASSAAQFIMLILAVRRATPT